MSYGMTSENSSGYAQIAEPFDNTSVFATGTATLQSPTSPTWTSLPAGTPDDILFFARPQNAGADLKFALYIDRPNSRFYFYDNPANAGSAVEYKILTKTQALTEPTSGYGLNVYNEDGNLSFTSEYGTSRVFLARTVTTSQASDDNLFNGVTGSLLDDTWAFMNAYGFFGIVQTSGSTSSLLAYKVKFDYTNDEIRSLVDSYGTLFFAVPNIVNVATRLELLARF